MRWLVVAALLVGAALFLLRGTAWALLRYASPPARLVVPVEGVAREGLRSSWGEPRSRGRRHAGIDIFARRGTPIVAAADGEVVRIGTTDPLGGNTVWVAGGGARLYYYAHLDGFRDSLHVGERVAAGQRLGRVGTTGNARGTPPHLHFGIYPAVRGFRPIDPAPLLR
jgi:murein DD-endopeptidase MepM/ murein hydrolase activator NlpD